VARFGLNAADSKEWVTQHARSKPPYAMGGESFGVGPGTASFALGSISMGNIFQRHEPVTARGRLKVGMAIALASASAVFFGFSNICFKLGVGPFGEIDAGKVASLQFIRSLLTSKWIIAGILLTVVSGAFYIAAMSYADVVKVVAVLSLSYLVTAILARLLLSESLTAFNLAGLGLIILGIIVVHARS